MSISMGSWISVPAINNVLTRAVNPLVIAHVKCRQSRQASLTFYRAINHRQGSHHYLSAINRRRVGRVSLRRMAKTCTSLHDDLNFHMQSGGIVMCFGYCIFKLVRESGVSRIQILMRLGWAASGIIRFMQCVKYSNCHNATSVLHWV
jgi:hypothetical protein